MSNRENLPLTPAEIHAAMSEFLRDLDIPENLVELEVLEFRRELTNETDRGVALYAAAHLDERLAKLLRAFLVQDEAVAEPLFKGIGAFASFSARIDTAYLLGLVPASVRRELHLVRKIRNGFAHEAKPLRFSDDPIAARCRELTRASLAENPRSKFVQAAMGLAGIIDGGIRLLSEGRQVRCVQAKEVTPQNPDVVKEAISLLAEYLPQDVSPPSDGNGAS